MQMRARKMQNNFVKKFVCVLMFICLIIAGVSGYYLLKERAEALTEGIDVPKFKLPENTNLLADMVGLFVYQGRIYVSGGSSINPENAEKICGEKIGTTKFSLSEWSDQDDYAVEFASSIGKQDVYTVKGYDKNFRLMTFNISQAGSNPILYECLNGITVKTGADVFNKIKMENNIKALNYESGDSWYYSKGQKKEIKEFSIVNDFVKQLKNTVPYFGESLLYLLQHDGLANRKVLYFTLNDGSEVKLDLFKNGYVYYVGPLVFFKMNNFVFNKLWDILE